MATNYVAKNFAATKTPAQTAAANAQWAKVGMTANIAGSVGSVIAAWAQAKREKAIAKANAAIAEQAAQDAMYRGRQEQLALGLKQQQMKGQQRTAFAANNIALDSQTAIDVQSGSDLIARMDATNIENNARREAYAAKLQQSNYQAQAASINPFMAAGGSLLEGAGKVADKWTQNNRVFGSSWSKNWWSGG